MLCNMSRENLGQGYPAIPYNLERSLIQSLPSLAKKRINTILVSYAFYYFDHPICFKIYLFILEREWGGREQRERERESQATSALSAEQPCIRFNRTWLVYLKNKTNVRKKEIYWMLKKSLSPFFMMTSKFCQNILILIYFVTHIIIQFIGF